MHQGSRYLALIQNEISSIQSRFLVKTFGYSRLAGLPLPLATPLSDVGNYRWHDNCIDDDCIDPMATMATAIDVVFIMMTRCWQSEVSGRFWEAHFIMFSATSFIQIIVLPFSIVGPTHLSIGCPCFKLAM